MDKLERGTQIIYVPMHAEKDIGHPDVEFGFVTSGPTKNGAYFCRYWLKHHFKKLRTKLNSELTPGDCLRVVETYSDEFVEEMLEKYC